MVKKISQNEFNEVTASEVAVIDFSATWCGPCKMLAPVLDTQVGFAPKENIVEFIKKQL